jgi:transcriptional regulator with XRE-family HTH domain
LKLPKLREVRELHGLSQSELAKKAHVSRDSISNYETGQREAWPSTAKKLANALDVSIADLMDDSAPRAVLTSPLLEWAMTTSDDEFERHIKTAPVSEATELLKINNVIPRKNPERERILERVSKTLARLQEFEGHWETDTPTTQEEQTGQEAS